MRACPLVKAVSCRLVVFAIFADNADVGDGTRCKGCDLHIVCHAFLLLVDGSDSISPFTRLMVGSVLCKRCPILLFCSRDTAFKVAASADAA